MSKAAQGICYFYNSQSLSPKFMQLLPDIKYHMKRFLQYFNIYLSNNTVFMKKTNIASN